MIDKSIRQGYRWGGPGGKSPGTSASGGTRGGPGPGGQGARGQATQNPGTTGKTGKTGTGETAKEKAIRTAAITTKTETKGPHRDTKEQKKEQLAIDLSKFGFEDKRAKPKVPTTPKKAAGPFDYLQGTKPKTETITVRGKDDQVFTITRPKKFSPTYHQDRSKIGGETWGERAEKSVRPGSGIMGTLGKALKWGAMALVPGLLPTTLAKALTTYNQAKTLSHYAKKAGLTETDIMSGLTSNITDDLFSGKGTTTDTRDDRFGQGDRQEQKIEAPKADVVTESVQKFSPRQMDLVRQRYDQLRQVMQSGEYMGQKLNNNQLASLQNVSKQMEAFLVDPQKMMMARGGIAGLHG